jgi:uncharacterized protein (TIGR02118 family)
MITVSVLYPNTAGLKFNMTYYLGTHIPLLQKLLGAALKGVLVQQGIGGAAPGSTAQYEVITELKFDSLESYQAAFGPHAPAVMGDLPNFCSESPIVQINNVRLG